MEKTQQDTAAWKQENDGILVEILKTLRELKSDNIKLQQRLSRIETTLENVVQEGKTPENAPPGEANYDTFDKFITAQIQNGLDQESRGNVDPAPSDADTNWNYFIAQKGGFDEVLYMTVQDFLNVDRKRDASQLLALLLQKRNKEVEESFQHLKTEYENLEGHQLQKHFTELWDLHHSLLKKKIIRTWKEEIFLEAFDQFLKWLQQ
ncbi:hypothetical protein U14_01471 [Candidatus Moduliflexus flocculans]|uniref:Uncharacterized protein n=1 Tax=Candidatus Moduliflexus flocculans TaxID=1499966 RepID=A0A0S6VVQ2_9BACT|nr:hypothetical protein U14_01471 [Candidatus Moduliflexus flocculans]